MTQDACWGCLLRTRGRHINLTNGNTTSFYQKHKCDSELLWGLGYGEVSGPGDLPFYGRGSMIVTAATIATMTAMTVRMMTSTTAAMMTKLGLAYCPVEHLSA